MHGVRPVRRFDLDDDRLFDDEVGAMPADDDVPITHREWSFGNVRDLLRIHLELKSGLIRILWQARTELLVHRDGTPQNAVSEIVQWETIQD